MTKPFRMNVRDRMVSRFVLANLTVLAIVLQAFMDWLNASSPIVAYMTFAWVFATIISVFVWLAMLIHHAVNYYVEMPTLRNVWILTILLGTPVMLVGPVFYYLYVLEYRSRTIEAWGQADRRTRRTSRTPNQAL